MHRSTKLRYGQAEDVGMDPARVELIRERARGWVAAGDTPSLVLLLARRGVVVLEEAYGILRPSDHAPLQTDAIFAVRSTTKPFTAAAIMCLVEDGLLSLKHPVTDYVPELSTAGADQVLIADLLTHTSGYDDMVVYPHAAKGLAAEQPVSDPAPGQHPLTNSLIRLACDSPLVKPPGEAMIYCNFGYDLLGDIVRRVSGRPLADFMASRFFDPLGMTDSYLVLPEAERYRRVQRETGFPDMMNPFVPAIDTVETDGFDAGGSGLKTTAHDLASFAQMLLNGGTYDGERVMSKASVAMMTAPQLPPGTPSYFSIADLGTGARLEIPIRGGNYGFGLFISTQDDRTAYMNGSLVSPRTFSHEGYGACNFWVDPDAELVGVYLSVIPRVREGGWPFWRCDAVQDMAQAAVVD